MSSITPEGLYDSTVSASSVWPGHGEAGRGRLSRRGSPGRVSGAASTVLVVNDSPDSLELMSLLLSRAGYSVLTAFDGQEGFEVASRERPRLVVSDVSMPRTDGIELCRLMRGHEGLRDTPVLLVSAIRKDSESVVEGLKAGADDYLEAPYDPTLLLTKVAHLVKREETEEALRESQARLAGVVESAMDAIITVDAEQRVLLFNRAAEQMFRCAAADALGRPLDRFIPERFRAAHAAHVLAFGRSEVSSRFMAGAKAVPALRADGEEFPVEASISQVEAGGQKLYTVILRDITERKQAEDDLRRQKEVLQKIFDHIPVMISFWTEPGRFELVNREWERVRGWSLEEIRESPADILDDSYPDPQERQRARDFIHAATGEWKDFKTRARDGCMIDTMWACLRLSDGTGISIGQDITERKRAEEKLRRSESQLVEAQRLAGIGSWNLDLQNNSLTWSEELYRMYGVDPQEFTPTLDAFMSFLHPEDIDFVTRTLDTAVKNLEPLDYQFRLVRRDGEVRILHSRGKIVADEHGLPLRMYGAAQDVTERVLAEERLKGSNEKLRALAARLQAVREEESIKIAREIHDELGGGLTGLKMDVSWIERRLPGAGDEAVRQKLRSMSELIDETIQQVRNISTELRPSVLDDLGLAAAIEWQAREFQRRTEIECVITSLDEEVALSAEKSTAVFRIFQEVLTNVARHARATRVEISMEKPDGHLVLRVCDDGRGIRESDISETKSLGLLGMRERAVVFGGVVEIEGAGGRGTTVTVRIPLE